MTSAHHGIIAAGALVTCLLLANPVAPASAQTRAYFHAEGWGYAEPVPLMEYADDWRAPLDRGSDGFAWLQVESGVQVNQWQLGWVLQRQYAVKASRDAARLYHLDRNDLQAQTNRVYDVDVAVSFYEARGLRLGRTLPQWSAGTWRAVLHPSIILWQGDTFEDGTLVGTASANAQAELTYAATLRHHYSEDALLDRRIARPEGRGASLDLTGQLFVGEHWSGDFQLRNLTGRMWWRDAPLTTGALGSDTRQTDEDGAVNFAPTLSGIESSENFRQRLALFADLKLRRAWGSQGAVLGLKHTEIGTFPSLGWDREKGALRYGLDWSPSARHAIRIHLNWGAVQLQVGGSAWRWDEAEQLSVQVGLNIPLRAAAAER